MKISKLKISPCISKYKLGDRHTVVTGHWCPAAVSDGGRSSNLTFPAGAFWYYRAASQVSRVWRDATVIAWHCDSMTYWRSAVTVKCRSFYTGNLQWYRQPDKHLWWEKMWCQCRDKFLPTGKFTIKLLRIGFESSSTSKGNG